MKPLKTSLQTGCLRMLRAIARPIRSVLTPAVRPPEFRLHPIVQGPAAGSSIVLPQETEIADIITEGRYEPEVLKLVEALIRPTDTCYDIGGHYGYYSLCLAAFATAGSVHTFEPVPAHAERIRQSAAASQRTNVTVHETAVSDAVGEATLQMACDPLADDSMAYLTETGGVHSPAAEVHYAQFSPVTVRTTTLPEITVTVPPPDFIKIDAEGAEAAIVQAGLETLQRHRPRLLIETHGVHEALTCAEHFRKISYCGVLTRRQDTTMPVLWVHHTDQAAIEAATRVFGQPPTIVCTEQNPREAVE